MNDLKIGTATEEPVSRFPRGRGVSNPTKTPATKSGEKPTNHAFVLSLVVPVFPARTNPVSCNFLPVPLFITPSSIVII